METAFLALLYTLDLTFAVLLLCVELEDEWNPPRRVPQRQREKRPRK